MGYTSVSRRLKAVTPKVYGTGFERINHNAFGLNPMCMVAISYFNYNLSLNSSRRDGDPGTKYPCLPPNTTDQQAGFPSPVRCSFVVVMEVL